MTALFDSYKNLHDVCQLVLDHNKEINAETALLWKL